MATEEHNELDWQAFLYVADEMPPDQRRQFEARLAEDQHAREAVACAVEIGQAISHAAAHDESHPVQRAAHHNTTRPSRWLKLEWMSIGAAACLAVVLLYAATTRPPVVVDAGGSREVAVSSVELEKLAQLWGAQREEASSSDSESWRVEGLALWPNTLGPNTLGPNTLGPEFDGSADDEQHVGDQLADDLAGIEAPPWMLAAVAGLSQDDEGDTGRELEMGQGVQEN